MGFLRGLFRRREVVGIADEALEFALEASEDAHPNEYMGFLRGTPTEKIDTDADLPHGYVVTDVLVIPGTTSGPTSATVRENMVPNDMRTLGSIHSHPNGVLRPSDEDLATFGSGTVHVIVGAPYRRGDWRAFDNQGEPTSLEVLDVPLSDPEDFFHFTQDDLDLDEERRR